MKTRNRKLWLMIITGIFFLTAIGVPSFADEFPTKPINVLVALPAAGSVSLSFRFLAAQAEKTLGQPFSQSYENGGGGSVACGIVAKQAPDGYHLLACSSTSLIRLPQFRPVPYNFENFVPILSWGQMQSVLYVHADSPWKTFREFIDYAKKNPGKVTYQIMGYGQPMHLAMLYIAKQDGIEWTAIPASENPTLQLLGGHVTASSSGTAYAGLAEAGKLRILAAHSPERLKRFPDVPTLRELGYDFVNESVMMLVAPKGTPEPIIKKLNNALHAAMDDPEFIKYMDTVATIVYRDGKSTKEYLDDAYVRLGKQIKELKVQTQFK